MLLARAHYTNLVLLWLTFAVPVLLISSVFLLFDLSLYWVLFINWWFKPLYELPLLLYLSKVIFNQPAPLKDVLKETRTQLPALLRSYLTFSRLSTARSITAPVVFLENLKGRTRRARVSVLTAETTRAYTLMMAWLNVEGIAYYVLLGTALTQSPFNYSLSELQAVFEGNLSGLSNTVVAIVILIPTVVAALVAPMYVGAGFLLYINRRMRLEAWDIEHQFLTLESRHQQKATLGASTASFPALASMTLGLLFSMLLYSSVAPVNAQERSTPRVTEVREEVKSVFTNESFGSTKTVKKLRFIPSDDNDKEDKPDSALVLAIVKAIIAASRIVVYVAAGIILVLIVWALLKFGPKGFHLNRRPTLETLDVEHHPLTRSLPQDIEASALAALNNNNPREALSLLYRGALGSVMRKHSLSIPASATEAECQQLVAQCNNTEQTQSFNRITHQWSQIAYANRFPTQAETLELIDYWKAKFANPNANANANEPLKGLP